jgi:hypothetical protein
MRTMSEQKTLADYAAQYLLDADRGRIEYHPDSGDITFSVDGEEVRVPADYEGYVVLDEDGVEKDADYDVETENRNGASPAYPTWRPECHEPLAACDLEQEENPLMRCFSGSIAAVAKTHRGHRDTMAALIRRYSGDKGGWESSKEWEEFLSHVVYAVEDYGGAAVHADMLRVVCRHSMDAVTKSDEAYAEIVFDFRRE